jgi:hypothetical protein
VEASDDALSVEKVRMVQVRVQVPTSLLCILEFYTYNAAQSNSGIGRIIAR